MVRRSANVVYAALGGIVVGAIYLWADRNLWVFVAIHSLFDVMRLAQFCKSGNELPI
jgi:membrane protease YdiL (CAAX protease family)